MGHWHQPYELQNSTGIRGSKAQSTRNYPSDSTGKLILILHGKLSNALKTWFMVLIHSLRWWLHLHQVKPFQIVINYPFFRLGILTVPIKSTEWIPKRDRSIWDGRSVHSWRGLHQHQMLLPPPTSGNKSKAVSFIVLFRVQKDKHLVQQDCF